MLANTMTCVDVMYQPYASYFGYQRTAPGTAEAFKKYGMQKMPDALDTGHYSSLSLASSSSLSTKQEEELEKEQPQNTQYLKDNCIVLTYFSGDAAANVDEHFSRALSQPSSFNPENQGSKAPGSYKDTSPMSQRNFPASFWNSAYQPAGGSGLPTSSHPADPLGLHSSDPYMAASSLHSMSAGLHQDPWRYPLSTQAHTYPHHSVHGLAYSTMADSASRFNSHYGSLLPSAAGRLGGQCDLSKHTEPWGARYADPLGTSSLASHHDSHLHSAAAAAAAGLTSGGVESPSQDSTSTSASPYWF